MPMQNEPPGTPTVLVDWKETLMPESREPTLPRRVIFSAVASDRSSRELLMAERRSTTPLDAVAEELGVGEWVCFQCPYCRSIECNFARSFH